jgi:NADH-quinone oxidoreductase subunit L
LLTIAAFLTAFYMGRQIWMVFFGTARHEAAGHAEESPKVMTVPLMILAALAIAGGVMNLPKLHSLTLWLEHTIEGLEAGEFNFLVAGLSTFLALAAIALSWVFYGRKPLAAGEKDPLKKLLGPLFTVFERKYWVDEAYWAVFVNRYVDISRFLADIVDGRFWHDFVHDKVIAGTYNWISRTALDKRVDQQFIDAIANGLGSLTRRVSGGLRRLQNGFVRSYALAILAGVVVILGYLILK